MLAVLALLAAGGGIFAILTLGETEERAGAGPQPPLVRIATAETAERVTVRQTGFVRPMFEVDVAAEVPGRIAELGEGFRLGARLEAGDMLFRLETGTFEAALAQAEARLEQARTALNEAQVSRARAEELQDSGFASEERLQQSVLGVARSEAELAAARAAITEAESNLADATVTAPFDALVTARAAAPGQILQPGVGVGRLVALEAAEVEMGLVPPDVAFLGDLGGLVGTEVEVYGVGPGRVRLATGVVVDVDPGIEQRTRTTNLLVRIPEAFADRAPRPLRIDELVELALPAPLPEDSVLSLPAAALADRDTVWRIDDSRLRRTPVSVLQRIGDRVLVQADSLEAGSRVMISDMAAAFDGQEVRLPGEGDSGAARTASAAEGEG